VAPAHAAALRLSLRRAAQEGQELARGNDCDPAIGAEGDEVGIAADEVSRLPFDRGRKELVLARVSTHLNLCASRQHDRGGLQKDEQILCLTRRKDWRRRIFGGEKVRRISARMSGERTGRNSPSIQAFRI
jgi:hypothetical protein